MSKLWNKNIMLYPSMALVIFYWWFFISFYKAILFCMFHSTGVFASPHSPSKNSDTCMWYVSNFNGILFAPLCITLGVHTKSMFEKGSKFIKVYQNLVIMSPFLVFFSVFFLFYHVKTHLCIDCDLGIRPMLVRKVHLHYPLPSLNHYY